MRIIGIICLSVSFVAFAAAGDDSSFTDLTVAPMPVPEKALEVLLLPESVEIEPDNAAVVYLALINHRSPERDDQFRHWLDAPLAQLKGATIALEQPDGTTWSPTQQDQVISGLRLASLKATCDWQRSIQGFNFWMPDLGKHRGSA